MARICDQMQAAEINIACVAVGGIRTEDVQPLLEAGCNGLAISGAIAFADDMTQATRNFIAMLPAGV